MTTTESTTNAGTAGTGRSTKPNKQQRMAARIARHGASLLAMFPDAITRNPIELSKSLRRWEVVAERLAVDACNVGVSDEAWDKECERITGHVARILGVTPTELTGKGFFINGDPRGCSLKIDDKQAAAHNKALRDADKHGFTLYSDWGGYGCLAPDLTND